MKSKYTLEERIKLVEEQKSSGLTISEFTKQKNIKQTTFQNWTRRVQIKKENKLVKVDIKPILQPKQTLIMINNIKLEIPASITSIKIAQIISAIREN